MFSETFFRAAKIELFLDVLKNKIVNKLTKIL